MANTSIARRLGIAFLTIVTTLVIATSTPLGPATPALANGCLLWNGTVYAVDDEADLDFLRSSPICLSRTLVQTANIDLSALNGSTWVPVSDFAGTYDGNGKTISGLELSGSNSGLFNTTTSAVTVKNLNVIVLPTSSAVNQVGSIVGNADGPVSIHNVSVSANFSGGDNVGGLIGRARRDVTISASSVTGTITAAFSVGGMVGRSEAHDLNTIRIVDSQAGVDVSISGSFAGGLFGVGVDTDLVVDNTSVEATVTSGTVNGGWAAGFVGAARDIVVNDSYASGEIQAGIQGYAGGFIAALFRSAHVTRSYWNGNVAGAGFSSGFIGFGTNATIVSSYCLGHITSPTGQAAGFIGQVAGFLSVHESFNACSTTAPISGGFFSEAAGSVSISNSYSAGPLSGSVHAAGFGWRTTGNLSVTNSYVTSSLSGAGSKSKFVVQPLGSSLLTNTFCNDNDCSTPNSITANQLKSTGFLSGRGWNFDQVWCVAEGLNNGFPVLRGINFGPATTTGCSGSGSTTGPVVSLLRASLDTNGGTCVDGSTRTDPWTSSFLGYRYLPGASDCTRTGYTFAGWANTSTPTNIRSLPLLVDPSDGAQRYFVAENLDLIAVWTPNPTTTPTTPVVTPPPTLKPTVFFGVRGWLCRNCGVLLFWSTPTTGTPVSVASPTRATVCTNSTLADGEWTMCHVKTGRAGTYTLTINLTTLTAVVR